jgi:steroid delta-isomerase
MPSTSPLSDGPRNAVPIDRFVGFFEGLEQADLAGIGEVYTDDIHFVDPFSDFHGLQTLTGIFEAMFTKMQDYQLVVHEYGMIGPDTGFVRWTMSGYVKQLGKEKWVVDGGSLVRFAEDGRVREHIDYWDAASQMYERLPIIGWILRKIRMHLAQH